MRIGDAPGSHGRPACALPDPWQPALTKSCATDAPASVGLCNTRRLTSPRCPVSQGYPTVQPIPRPLPRAPPWPPPVPLLIAASIEHVGCYQPLPMRRIAHRNRDRQTTIVLGSSVRESLDTHWADAAVQARCHRRFKTSLYPGTRRSPFFSLRRNVRAVTEPIWRRNVLLSSSEKDRSGSPRYAAS